VNGTEDRVINIRAVAEEYHKQGYNILRIIPKGAKFTRYEKTNEKTIVITDIADGKSAEGTGRWMKWKEQKQTVSDVIELFKDDYKAPQTKKKCQYGIAIIHGNVSRMDVDTLELDHHGQPKQKPTGSCVFECDGEGADLLMEAVLQSEHRYKLLNSPRARTPSSLPN
jgi:hypothetical protein